MARILAYTVEALDAIWRNRLRSLLTMLGMIIGIASVITVLGLSQAASRGLESELSAGGDPGIVAFVDQSQDLPSIATLYYRDVARIVALSGGAIRSAIPIYGAGGGRNLEVTGVGKPNYISGFSSDGDRQNANLIVDSGRLLRQSDVTNASPVCIIAKSSADKLFPSGNALGQSISVGDMRLNIVGIYTLKGSLLNSFTGDSMFIPYTTFHLLEPGAIDGIQAWPADTVSKYDAIVELKSLLASVKGPKAQYTIQDQAASLGIFSKVLDSIGIGLTFIGALSLVVAGVGIMNIMLVSIAERTREIGIRKSIGASAADISFQFLVESIIVSFMGGAIGMLLGILCVNLGSTLLMKYIGVAPIPWTLIISVAVGFSLAVGIGFGSYPAARAGRLDPVEALRS